MILRVFTTSLLGGVLAVLGGVLAVYVVPIAGMAAGLRAEMIFALIVPTGAVFATALMSLVWYGSDIASACRRLANRLKTSDAPRENLGSACL